MKILITGTSKGIGHLIANSLLNDNHDVIGVSRSNSTIQHKSYSHIKFDLSQVDKLESLVDELPEKIDILINSAAIALINPLHLYPNDELIKIINTNFISPLILTKEISKKMIPANFGRIINISSIASLLAPKGESPYTLSKVAIESMATTLNKELFPFGITINTIRISLADTDLLKKVPNKELDKLKNNLVVKEFVSIDEIMHSINFLISHRSNNITGQTIGFGGIN